MSNWIPCSRALPQDGQRAIVTILLYKDMRHVSTAQYFKKNNKMIGPEWNGKGFYQYDSEFGYILRDDVIAWMPVEPYKGD